LLAIVARLPSRTGSTGPLRAVCCLKAQRQEQHDQDSITNDERAIRDLVATWMAASQAGDTAKVCSLMADDVIFQVPGREPFGKKRSPPCRKKCPMA
jgi:hypothetical protein